VAWPEHDRVLQVKTCSQPFRELIRDAEWRELPGVGHVPMADDPALVSRTILDWAAAHAAVTLRAG
jgi:pimeloyl-ACP methyl ester carboxylesterase